MFANLLKIPSSDPEVDACYQPYEIKGIVFYYTREPNLVVDITATWETKLAALQCYETQFTPEALQELAMALMGKSMQVCAEKAFQFGEPFKVLHPSALHCGI
jgi:LmbE family N-acetylglucosaminyl deacetylase